MLTYLLQDREGQILDTHSIAAGLDYPGVGPEHSYLKDNKRVKYDSVSDQNAIDAFLIIVKFEGIYHALELTIALVYVIQIEMNVTKKKKENKHIVLKFRLHKLNYFTSRAMTNLSHLQERLELMDLYYLTWQ